MILSHEDLQAISRTLGPDQAAPVIQTLEKLDREQRVEVKRELLTELATKADIARLEGKTERVEVELKGEMKRLEMLIKILIGLAVVGMAFFSPMSAELVRLLKQHASFTTTALYSSCMRNPSPYDQMS